MYKYILANKTANFDACACIDFVLFYFIFVVVYLEIWQAIVGVSQVKFGDYFIPMNEHYEFIIVKEVNKM